jgi:hypothetical protein
MTVALPAHADEPPSITCPEDTGRRGEMERKGQRLFDEALRREPADPRAALELLLCVQRFADKPAVALRIGTIAERLGKLDLAVRSFERYLALAGAAAPDREEMSAHIRQLRDKLGRSQPPPAEPPPQREPEPSPPPEHAERKPPIFGWGLAAGGGLLMVVGGVLLYSAKQRSDDVQAIEPGTTLWNSEAARSEFEQAKREQTLGIVSLALGAAAATAGAVLVVSAEHQVSAGASVSRDSATARLRVRF